MLGRLQLARRLGRTIAQHDSEQPEDRTERKDYKDKQREQELQVMRRTGQPVGQIREQKIAADAVVGSKPE
ncbi:MAG TPA: hypothetical protein VFI87_07070, partial [Hyphomicrobiaceae bacterium]|nr:hypothetical protein [Hyphomicrobiaceae bacterium]